MIASIRQKFNAAFTEESHQNYLAALNTTFPGALDFSVAETPIFIDKNFTEKVLATGDYVNQVIQSGEFNSITEPSLKNIPLFPNETALPQCIVMDFAIATNEQKTRIDFYCTEKYFNIPIVCITELFIEERHLYYERVGKKIKIDRIYNRIVLDELKNQTKEIQEKGALLQNNLEIEWVTHPHHFFRISKFLLPFLKHTYIPRTQFVSQLTETPRALEKYILKPLFSFAGQGVIIDISADDIMSIKDPSGWILQEKVNYANCIETPTGPAKAELRLYYFWDEDKKEYIATMNLARLSKGKMIGVNYNKNKQWVGGSLAYFEKH